MPSRASIYFGTTATRRPRPIHFSQMAPTAGPVPEPSSIVLAAMSFVGALFYLRRLRRLTVHLTTTGACKSLRRRILIGPGTRFGQRFHANKLMPVWHSQETTVFGRRFDTGGFKLCRAHDQNVQNSSDRCAAAKEFGELTAGDVIINDLANLPHAACGACQ